MLKSFGSCGGWYVLAGILSQVIRLLHQMPVCVMMEYFIDTDPGVGNEPEAGSCYSSVNINAFPFNVDLSGVAKGMHRGVCAYTKDVTGKWSLTNNAFFEKISLLPVYPSVAAAGSVTAIEYHFVDTDRGRAMLLL